MSVIPAEERSNPVNVYMDVMRKIYNEGVDVWNPSYQMHCRTIINVDMEYDLSTDLIPLITSRKLPFKKSVAEIIAYIRGIRSAAEMRAIGTNTWDGNANDNPVWNNSPHRKGHDDLGMIYGAVARNWPKYDGTTIDLWNKVYEDLRKGKDDRSEIVTFYNPGMFDLGCLRPCMYEHHFSVLGDKLYLTSKQRSNDFALGGAFNMPQVYVLGRLMAQITGLKGAKAFHKSTNVHIYENQLPAIEELLERPYVSPTARLWINPEIKTMEDVCAWVTVDDFKILDYSCNAKLDIPLSTPVATY